MRTRTIYAITLMAGLFLITSCTGLTGPKPTSTPDPCPKDVLETVVRDFDDLKKEIDDLAAVADDTPVKVLFPITIQLNDLQEEIKGYEFPLCAAKAQSALYYYSNSTVQCYASKYAEYIYEASYPEDIAYHCNKAQLLGEGVDLMLQELNEMIAAK